VQPERYSGVVEVVRVNDANAALELVSEPLRASGAEGEVAFGILRRLTGEPHAWGAEVDLLVGRRDGEPAVLVTMTGVLPALFVGFTATEEIGFRDLAAAMLASGRRPPGVNGARRVSEPFARAFCEIAGARAEVRRDVRAFELVAVRPPPSPPGRFRMATAADGDVLELWLVAFGADIDEPTASADAARVVTRTTRANDLAVWEHDGALVSMAVVTRRTPWSSSIGLVYTPPELRRRGYASAVVAALSQRELDAGQRWCSLLADLANPTSNRIYAAIGYEPRCDLRHIALIW
jgi:predicted GNAT family acetyltransferase